MSRGIARNIPTDSRAARLPVSLYLMLQPYIQTDSDKRNHIA